MDYPNVRRSRRKGFAFLLLAAAGAVSILLAGAAYADNGAHGFLASGNIQTGWVVALDKTKPQSVKAAPASDTNQIYGVAVDPSDAPFVLNGDNAQVFVVTSGSYRVLVSAANGNIKTGDYISMSSIDGIAAKATANQSTILGRAEDSFDGKHNVITGAGQAAIGRIPVTIEIGLNPIANDNQQLPSVLRRISNSVAGHQVPAVRVYAALGVFLVAAVATVTILWGGVRSGITALGRNPLSRHTIFSGMYKVIFTGLAVFILGLAGVYLLLRI